MSMMARTLVANTSDANRSLTIAMFDAFERLVVGVNDFLADNCQVVAAALCVRSFPGCGETRCLHTRRMCLQRTKHPARARFLIMKPNIDD